MILRGEKVILRSIKLSDAPRFVKWLKDEEVYKYLQRLNRPLTLAKEREWIRNNLQDKTKKNFAIETFSKRHIGSVSVDLALKHKRAIFGIFIGEKKYWNQKLGQDATKTILDYSFKRLKLHRIGLTVFEYNPRAIHVYKKLGFKVEGRKRDYIKLNKKYYDAFEMSILDKEWRILNKKK